MTKLPKFLVVPVVAGLALLAIAAGVVNAPQYFRQRVQIQTGTNDVALTIQATSTTNNANFIECYRGSTLTWSVGTNGTVSLANGGTGATTATNARANLGIQTGGGTTTADGTVTNTFPTAFSTAPTVVVTQTGSTLTETNAVVSVTPSNFVYRAAANSITHRYIAVGTP